MDLNRIKVMSAMTSHTPLEVDDFQRFDLDLDILGPSREMNEILRRLDQTNEDETTVLADLLGGPETYAHSITNQNRRPRAVMDDLATKSPPTYDEHSFEVNEETAERVMESIHRRIKAAKDEGYHITQLVVGTPQYKTLLAWTQAEHGVDPDDYIGVDELIVVPGPQIHPVLPNKETLWRDL